MPFLGDHNSFFNRITMFQAPELAAYVHVPYTCIFSLQALVFGAGGDFLRMSFHPKPHDVKKHTTAIAVHI
jgi:hypothetical protein